VGRPSPSGSTATCSAHRETQLHPPMVPSNDSLPKGVQPFGCTAPVAFAANDETHLRADDVIR
jgi:hypothetical protein